MSPLDVAAWAFAVGIIVFVGCFILVVGKATIKTLRGKK